MQPPARIVACALAMGALASACEDGRQPPPPPPAQAMPERAPPFGMRDLALATAVDARAAKLSIVGTDVEAAVAATTARERAGAKSLLPALEVAGRELDQGIAAVANPLDRALANAIGAHARRYVQELSDAARSSAPGAGLALARRDLGDAIGRYRQSRATWRLDAPEPQGPEREFAEARRDLERAENGFISRAPVAPQTVEQAVRRARAAAGRLPPPPMREAALRYAAAQEKVLASAAALSQAAERVSAHAARAYHAAKVDALVALADYFAAAASR